MNDLERVLIDDAERLVDRLATSIPEGVAARVRETMPEVVGRIEAAEARLVAARAALLDDYASWRGALEDLENLWTVAGWKSTVAEEPASSVRRAA